MRFRSLTATCAAMVFASPIFAYDNKTQDGQTGAKEAPTVTTVQGPATAPASGGKPTSPFVLCDGRTGHVGEGSRLFRLLAVTATLGVSEAVTTKDDASKRQSGVAGAQSCIAALAQESDPERRIELLMAQSIHLLEGGETDEALAVIRTAPQVAGDYAQDAGFRRTLMPRVMLLEANILLRGNHLAEAEGKAVEALQQAPYDVAFQQRARFYLSLTPSLSPAKRQALEQMARVSPISSIFLAQSLAETGELAAAAQINADYVDLASAMYKKFSPCQILATQSLMLALAGDLAGSNAAAAKSEADIATTQAEGESSSRAALIAEASELLTLRGLIVDLKQGKASEARATFRAHGPWLLASRGYVYAAMKQLQTGAPATELTGNLADTADAWRARKIGEQVTAMTNEAATKREYGQATLGANAEEFRKAGRVAWTTGKKPKLLLPPPRKDPPNYEIMSTYTIASAPGLPGGEAMILQSALIARERGLDGVAASPVRTSLSMMAVRFGKVGTPGFPASLSLSPDKVIADLSPVIPQPPAGS